MTDTTTSTHRPRARRVLIAGAITAAAIVLGACTAPNPAPAPTPKAVTIDHWSLDRSQTYCNTQGAGPDPATLSCAGQVTLILTNGQTVVRKFTMNMAGAHKATATTPNGNTFVLHRAHKRFSTDPEYGAYPRPVTFELWHLVVTSPNGGTFGMASGGFGVKDFRCMPHVPGYPPDGFGGTETAVGCA